MQRRRNIIGVAASCVRRGGIIVAGALGVLLNCSH